jgi:hypothetical protein
MLDLGGLPDLVRGLIESLAGSNGVVLQVLTTLVTVMGVARLVVKPVMVALRAIADATPTPVDNQLLDNVEQSKVVKILVFLADWLLSVKLPPKK